MIQRVYDDVHDIAIMLFTYVVFRSVIPFACDSICVYYCMLLHVLAVDYIRSAHAKVTVLPHCNVSVLQ